MGALVGVGLVELPGVVVGRIAAVGPPAFGRVVGVGFEVGSWIVGVDDVEADKVPVEGVFPVQVRRAAQRLGHPGVGHTISLPRWTAHRDGIAARAGVRGVHHSQLIGIRGGGRQERAVRTIGAHDLGLGHHLLTPRSLVRMVVIAITLVSAGAIVGVNAAVERIVPIIHAAIGVDHVGGAMRVVLGCLIGGVAPTTGVLIDVGGQVRPLGRDLVGEAGIGWVPAVVVGVAQVGVAELDTLARARCPILEHRRRDRGQGVMACRAFGVVGDGVLVAVAVGLILIFELVLIGFVAGAVILAHVADNAVELKGAHHAGPGLRAHRLGIVTAQCGRGGRAAGAVVVVAVGCHPMHSAGVVVGHPMIEEIYCAHCGRERAGGRRTGDAVADLPDHGVAHGLAAAGAGQVLVVSDQLHAHMTRVVVGSHDLIDVEEIFRAVAIGVDGTLTGVNGAANLVVGAVEPPDVEAAAGPIGVIGVIQQDAQVRGMLGHKLDMRSAAIGSGQSVADMIDVTQGVVEGAIPCRGGAKPGLGDRGHGDRPTIPGTIGGGAGIMPAIGGLARIAQFQLGLEAAGTRGYREGIVVAQLPGVALHRGQQWRGQPYALLSFHLD